MKLPRGARWFAVAVLVAFSAAAGVWARHRRQSGVVGDCVLAVDPASLAIGDVWAQEHFPWSISIRNLDQEPIQIVRFHTSCGCVEATPSSVTIPGGGEASVMLTLDLSPRGPQRQAPEQWDFSTAVVPVTEAARGGVPYCKLTARVSRPVVFSPAVLDLGEVVRDGPRPLAQVKVHSRTPITGLKAQCDANLAAVEVTQAAAEFPGERSLTIRPCAELPLGPARFFVTVTPLGANGTEIPPQRLRVVGNVVDDVCALPAVLSLGPRKIGEVASDEVVLHSRSGRPFRVHLAQSRPSETSASLVEGEAQARVDHRLSITQRISKEGRRQNGSRWGLRAEGGRRTTELPVTISYYGVSADAGVGETRVQAPGLKTP